MRRAWIVPLLFILLMTACAPEAAATEDASEPAAVPTKTAIPTEPPAEAAPVPIGPAEEAAIKQLAASLGLEENEITVVSSEETEFSDACLGITMEGVMCAQVITPGSIVVLEADGIQFEYHTSQNGSTVQPATLALVWKREGGIAGFCDTLTVFRSGEAFATSCKAQSDGNMGTLAELLTASERTQFREWITEFEEAKLDQSDPRGVADRMIVTLEFFGVGAEQPTETEEQALFSFAQDLYEELAQ